MLSIIICLAFPFLFTMLSIVSSLFLTRLFTSLCFCFLTHWVFVIQIPAVYFRLIQMGLDILLYFFCTISANFWLRFCCCSWYNRLKMFSTRFVGICALIACKSNWWAFCSCVWGNTEPFCLILSIFGCSLAYYINVLTQKSRSALYDEVLSKDSAFPLFRKKILLQNTLLGVTCRQVIPLPECSDHDILGQ